MSVITVFKEANTLIFSTDSRMMKHDYSGVDSDTQQKIFNLAPETFIATSGRKIASEFQIARARELAVKLGTDIQAIGAALERDSFSILSVLLERLRQENDETTRQAVSGQILLHGCTLVGWSCGKLGFVTHSYFVQASGAIKCISESYFDGARKVTCMSGTPAHILAGIAAKFMYTPATWTDPLQQVSMRFLETVKRFTPDTIGGPWQVVRLDSAGTHWISEAPASRGAESDARAAGTCSASILLTAPAIDITTGGVRIQMDATNHLKISNSSTHVVVEVSDANVRVSSSVNSSFTTMTLGGVTVQDASGNWMSINSLHVWRNGSVVL
jgi:hypothetical protein